MILGITIIICFTLIIITALIVVDPEEFSFLRSKNKKGSEKTFHVKFKKNTKKED